MHYLPSRKAECSHTQVALKVLNRKVRSSPLLSSVTFHLPPPCVVRAAASRLNCSSSSPAEYWKRTVDFDSEEDMALTIDLETECGPVRRNRNMVVIDRWFDQGSHGRLKMEVVDLGKGQYRGWTVQSIQHTSTCNRNNNKMHKKVVS